MATDNFNRSDETLNVSANWTTILGVGLRVVSNQVAGAASAADTIDLYESAASGEAQYSQYIVKTLGTSTDHGPAVQCQETDTCIFFSLYSSGEAFNKFTSGTFSLISYITMSDVVANDVVKLEIDADGNLTAYVNAVSVGTATDTSFSLGQPGIFGYVTDWRSDDWEGGNLGGGGLIAKPLLRSFARQRAANY
jgi:hypothetical protein